MKNRVVDFHPLSRGMDTPEWDALFNALPDYFYGHWLWGRIGIAISSDHSVISISGWPAWYPAVFARAKIMAMGSQHGVYGLAYYTIERTQYV